MWSHSWGDGVEKMLPHICRAGIFQMAQHGFPLFAEDFRRTFSVSIVFCSGESFLVMKRILSSQSRQMVTRKFSTLKLVRSLSSTKARSEWPHTIHAIFTRKKRKFSWTLPFTRFNDIPHCPTFQPATFHPRIGSPTQLNNLYLTNAPRSLIRSRSQFRLAVAAAHKSFPTAIQIPIRWFMLIKIF